MRFSRALPNTSGTIVLVRWWRFGGGHLSAYVVEGDAQRIAQQLNEAYEMSSMFGFGPRQQDVSIPGRHKRIEVPDDEGLTPPRTAMKSMVEMAKGYPIWSDLTDNERSYILSSPDDPSTIIGVLPKLREEQQHRDRKSVLERARDGLCD